MTEFIVTRLRGAEHRDWMQLRQSLRRAIERSNLSLPDVLDVVKNIIGVVAHRFIFKGNWEEGQLR